MPKKDFFQLAFGVVQESTGEKSADKKPEKNPAAVNLGRLGGLKGGKARAVKLSSERRVEIAKNAASKRWDKNRDKTKKDSK